jgi:hypothetical protein
MRAANAFFRSEAYGVITEDVIRQICQKRLLAADLLSHASDRPTSHAAFMVRETVASIEAELMELIR